MPQSTSVVTTCQSMMKVSHCVTCLSNVNCNTGGQVLPQQNIHTLSIKGLGADVS